MGTYESFATNAGMEQEGIWIDYGDAGSFRVARAGGSNKNFTRSFQRLTKPHRKAIQADAMNDDTQRAIMMEVFIDSALLAWKGVTGKDGKTLSFSKKNAKALFEDLPDLFADLLNSSQNYSLYREYVMDIDSGNSSSASSTP